MTGEDCVETESRNEDDEGSIDTVFYVRAIDCTDGSDAAQLVCDDDGGEGLASSLRFDGVEGMDYFIFVDTYSELRPGPYSLNIRLCP